MCIRLEARVEKELDNEQKSRVYQTLKQARDAIRRIVNGQDPDSA